MRAPDEVIEDLQTAEGTPAELLDELFWCVMVRGLGSGTASWGKLFCDLRGWTKGGDVAPADVERISDAEAAKLVRQVLGAM
jgi:hypothetical protein